jgi:hypothetical protein
MEETEYFIYALVDPTYHVVGYIGVTTQGLDKRLTQHIAEAADGKGGIKKREWINDILQAGDYPLIMELDHCRGDEWPDKEQYWINSFRSRGYELTNTSDGGVGNPGVVKSDETRQKISDSMKEYKSTHTSTHTL